MEKKNVIFNHTLEQYNKKYKNRKHRLVKFTKSQVEEFDRLHKTNGGYLLKGRKWCLIKDTYYEIPKPIRFTWFRNLNAGVQTAVCLLGAGVIASAVTVPIVLMNKGGNTPITEDIVAEQDGDAKELINTVTFKKNSNGDYEGTIKLKEGKEITDIDELNIYVDDVKLTSDQYTLDKSTGKVVIKKSAVKTDKPKIKINIKKKETPIGDNQLTFGKDSAVIKMGGNPLILTLQVKDKTAKVPEVKFIYSEEKIIAEQDKNNLSKITVTTKGGSTIIGSTVKLTAVSKVSGYKDAIINIKIDVAPGKILKVDETSVEIAPGKSVPNKIIAYDEQEKKVEVPKVDFDYSPTGIVTAAQDETATSKLTINADATAKPGDSAVITVSADGFSDAYITVTIKNTTATEEDFYTDYGDALNKFLAVKKATYTADKVLIDNIAADKVTYNRDYTECFAEDSSSIKYPLAGGDAFALDNIKAIIGKAKENPTNTFEYNTGNVPSVIIRDSSSKITYQATFNNDGYVTKLIDGETNYVVKYLGEEEVTKNTFKLQFGKLVKSTQDDYTEYSLDQIKSFYFEGSKTSCVKDITELSYEMNNDVKIVKLYGKDTITKPCDMLISNLDEEDLFKNVFNSDNDEFYISTKGELKAVSKTKGTLIISKNGYILENLDGTKIEFDGEPTIISVFANETSHETDKITIRPGEKYNIHLNLDNDITILGLYFNIDGTRQQEISNYFISSFEGEPIGYKDHVLEENTGIFSDSYGIEVVTFGGIETIQGKQFSILLTALDSFPESAESVSDVSFIFDNEVKPETKKEKFIKLYNDYNATYNDSNLIYTENEISSVYINSSDDPTNVSYLKTFEESEIKHTTFKTATNVVDYIDTNFYKDLIDNIKDESDGGEYEFEDSAISYYYENATGSDIKSLVVNSYGYVTEYYLGNGIGFSYSVNEGPTVTQLDPELEKTGTKNYVYKGPIEKDKKYRICVTIENGYPIKQFGSTTRKIPAFTSSYVAKADGEKLSYELILSDQALDFGKQYTEGFISFDFVSTVGIDDFIMGFMNF